jgi:hypothetical protein
MYQDIVGVRSKVMNTHGIPAAPWQLGVAAKELKAILLPLTGGWVSGDPSTWPPIETLESEVKVGDRIFLQEEWAYFLDKVDREVYYPLKRTSPMYPYDWEPAHTMPPEAAQHWYTVTGVRVVRVLDLTPKDLRLSGLYVIGSENGKNVNEVTPARWNAAHPNYRWYGDLPVVVLSVEAIAL